MHHGVPVYMNTTEKDENPAAQEMIILGLVQPSGKIIFATENMFIQVYPLHFKMLNF